MPLVGFAYDVSPVGLALDTPFTLTIPLADLGLPSSSVQLFTFDETTAIWRASTDPVRIDGDVLTAVISSAGRYAVGLRQSVDAPAFLSTIDELVALAPKDTVAYALDVGYRLNGGPVVALAGLGESGGCGGVWREGSAAGASELSRNALVAVDDVATDVTFLFHAAWVVDNMNGGCPDTAPLTALSRP